MLHKHLFVELSPYIRIFSRYWREIKIKMFTALVQCFFNTWYGASQAPFQYVLICLNIGWHLAGKMLLFMVLFFMALVRHYFSTFNVTIYGLIIYSVTIYGLLNYSIIMCSILFSHSAFKTANDLYYWQTDLNKHLVYLVMFVIYLKMRFITVLVKKIIFITVHPFCTPSYLYIFWLDSYFQRKFHGISTIHFQVHTTVLY